MRTLLALCVSLVPVPAAAASASAAPADIFAIIVTSNRTEQLGRPELQYADDDGVRYYELFSMIAPRANLFLLTEL
ncbi:MAG TPA: hypothetical protein VNO33_08430, partial [Kofleriaceae bacterium]|nr:hypothetical protein [Kofleriaceae bacterium]